MKEIEIKIIEIDKKEIISKLKKLGAKKIFEGIVSGMTFKSGNPNWDTDKQMLRLRQEGDNFFLCLKSKLNIKSKAKVRDEIEVEINDLNNMKLILEKLGFSKQNQNTKYRTSYKLKNSRIEIEECKPFTPFLEIEAPNLKEIKKIVELLGFTMKDTKNWTLKDLFEYYNKK